MKPQSPLLKAFCTHWKSSIPEVAIIRAVESTFPDLKTVLPPIDLYRFALKRRARVFLAKIECDGIISRTVTGEYVIKLNKRNSEQRNRFTLAHEIGHTLFFDLEETVESRFRIDDSGVESICPDWEEEYICNVAAAEILMPLNHFSGTLQRLPPTVATILKLSAEYNTSLHATARRVVQLSQYRLLICLWEYKPAMDLYETLWIAKPYHERRDAQQNILVTENQPVFKTFTTESSFRGRRWISLGGPLDDYFVDGVVMASNPVRRVLTVFILESLAEHIIGQPISTAVIREQLRLF